MKEDQRRRTETLYHQVESMLLTGIESGHIRRDVPLLEVQVAEQLGVSRAPVRKALGLLAEKGIVRKRNGRGFDIVGSADARADGNIPAAGPSSRHRPSLNLGETDRRPAWQNIYAAVERDLVSRQVFASVRVNEQALADHFGVSRTVAREVLLRLQEVGIVDKDDRMRWIAPKLTADHVFDLYEMRWILEPVALRKAAPNLPAELVAQTRADLARVLGKFPNVSVKTLDKLEHNLHVDLLAYCHNRKIIQMLSQQRAIMISNHYIFDLYLNVPEEDPFIQEHLAIVDHLIAGDIDAAVESLTSHLKISLNRALSRIETISPEKSPPLVSYIRLQDD